MKRHRRAVALPPGRHLLVALLPLAIVAFLCLVAALLIHWP